MFHWNAGLYMDDKVKRKPARYRRIVEGRRIAGTCYCITLPANEKKLYGYLFFKAVLVPVL